MDTLDRYRQDAPGKGIAAPTGVTRAQPSSPASAGLDTTNAFARPLLLILLCGFAVRVVLWLVFWQQPLAIWDERDYNVLALGLLERGEFAFQPGITTSLRPPLYPAFLAGVYVVAGADNHTAVRFAQLVISMGTVLLVCALGTRLYSSQVGLCAAGLYAFYPSLLTYNNLLLTETLFGFLLCATCYALVRALQRKHLGLLFLAGVLLGVATLTRSVLWLFPPFLAVFLIVAWPGTAGRRMLAAAIATLAFAVTIAPWAIRNTVKEKTFVAIDTMGGRNFMMGNYEYTPEKRIWDAISLQGDQAWDTVVRAKHPDARGLTQGQFDKLALKTGLAYVVDQPGVTLHRDFIKFCDFWGLERELIAGGVQGVFGDIPKAVLVPLAIVIVGAYVAAMLLGCCGLAIAPPADWRFHVLLLMIVGFVTALHTASFGHSRDHLPLMPIILIYAASAIVNWSAVWAKRRSWSGALALVLMLVFTGIWIREVAWVNRSHLASLVANWQSN